MATPAIPFHARESLSGVHAALDEAIPEIRKDLPGRPCGNVIGGSESRGGTPVVRAIENGAKRLERRWNHEFTRDMI
jgi:hypothetical protein